MNVRIASAAFVVGLLVSQSASAQIFRGRARPAAPAQPSYPTAPVAPAVVPVETVTPAAVVTAATPAEAKAPGCCGGNPAATSAVVSGGAQPAPSAQPVTPSTTGGTRPPPCDGAPGGGVDCEIRIVKHHPCRGDCDWKPYPWNTTPVGVLPDVKGKDQDFYVREVPGKGAIKVPVTQSYTQEMIQFGTTVVKLPCCDVEVCIPCKVCHVQVKNCVIETRVQSLLFKVRYDGLIDVYAANVQGMPQQYVVYVGWTRDQVNQRFPGQLP